MISWSKLTWALECRFRTAMKWNTWNTIMKINFWNVVRCDLLVWIIFRVAIILFYGCFGWGDSRVVQPALIEALWCKSCHPGGLLPLSNMVIEMARENDMFHQLLPSNHLTMNYILCWKQILYILIYIYTIYSIYISVYIYIYQYISSMINISANVN